LRLGPLKAITESPRDGSALQASPFLVKTRGAEVGLRSKLIPGLTSAVSLFLLDSASEILFSGDAGDTVARAEPPLRHRVDQRLSAALMDGFNLLNSHSDGSKAGMVGCAAKSEKAVRPPSRKICPSK
jgi:hypothetical protein